MKCNNCGAPLNGDVCEYCGSAVPKADEPSSAQKPTNSNFTHQKKTCPHCKSVVNANLKICSHCGKVLPTNGNTAVGCLIIVAVIFLAFSIISLLVDTIASNISESVEPDIKQEIIIDYEAASLEETSSEESASQNTEYVGVNNTADLGDVKVTISDFKTAQKGAYSLFDPGDEKVFVAINFIFENTSDEDIYCAFTDIDAYVNDIKQQFSSSAQFAFSEWSGKSGGSVAPGKKTEVVYALELDEGWSSIELIVSPEYDGRSATFIINNE